MWKITVLKFITYLSVVGEVYIAIHVLDDFSILENMCVVAPTIIMTVIVSIGYLETLNKVGHLKNHFSEAQKAKFLSKHEAKLKKRSR